MNVSLITGRFLRACGIGLLFFYFSFHMLHGDEGLVGRAIEMHKQERLRQELAIVHKQRLRLERDIALMSGATIDADLLGELARKKLPVAGEREIMLMR